MATKAVADDRASYSNATPRAQKIGPWFDAREKGVPGHICELLADLPATTRPPGGVAWNVRRDRVRTQRLAPSRDAYSGSHFASLSGTVMTPAVISETSGRGKELANAAAGGDGVVRAQARAPLVLVADDNEGNRALVRSTLRPEGYRVLLVHDGEEAIAAFQKEAPDCIVLDIRMPKVDGFAACRKIRELPNGATVPILFFTALRDVDTFDEALAAGGDDFLTKPVRPSELLVRVQTALKLRGMSTEIRQYLDLVKQQRDDLLRLQLQKERVMAFVVHDLKNPVNAMDLHAQLLLRNHQLPEDAHESASQIRGEARLLTRMIVNLLDLSKAEEGKLVLARQRVDLTSLTNEVVQELGAAASRRKVRLVASVSGVHVSADADLLRRTLANLVENALRHTPPDTTVEVRASSTKSGVEIRVADAGPGVPEEARDRIFDPFTQLSNNGSIGRSERGLGLAFCKMAVEAHGGRIWVEDAAPGAIFCMTYPDGD